jgi:hypothetical protein
MADYHRCEKCQHPITWDAGLQQWVHWHDGSLATRGDA